MTDTTLARNNLDVEYVRKVMNANDITQSKLLLF